MRIVLMVFLGAAVASGADTVTGCEPVPEVRAAIERIARSGDAQREQAAKFDALLAARPDDFFVHRARLGYLRGPSARNAEAIVFYKRRLDAGPRDPARIMLYARALIGTQTPQAIRLLEAVITAAPAFSWPHLQLAEIYVYPRFRDKVKQAHYAGEFFSRCPEVLEVYPLISRMDASELTRQAARSLRPLLEKRSDEESLRTWSALWTLEFKNAAPKDQDALRKRVNADLQRLASLTADRKDLRGTLLTGYKLSGNTQEAARLENEMRAPRVETPAVPAIFGAYAKDHPAPRGEASREQWDAWHRDLLAWANNAIRQWPQDAFGYWKKMEAAEALGDLPEAEIESAAEAILRMPVESGTPSVPPDAIRVAQFYAARGMKLDRVPTLVHAALRDALRPGWPYEQPDWMPAAEERDNAWMLRVTQWAAWGALFDATLKTGNMQRAREILNQMSNGLEEDRPGEKANAGDEFRYRGFERSYLSRMAAFALAAQRPAEALLHWQRLLQGAGNENTFLRVRTIEQARAVWRQLNGTSEGWQTWLAGGSSNTLARGPAWTLPARQLSEFTLTDVNGKTWRSADLKGKITFLNVWTTWCGVCTHQLRSIDKLYQKLKDRKDVQIITWNADDSPALTDSFLKDNAYDFPVLIAKSYLDQAFPTLTVPRTWLVDTRGVVRFEQRAAGVDEKWEERVLAMIERAVRGEFKP